ncbi:MAG: helix-turn-helix transcriptional regulator [Burkholderiaceae bacterium]|nr:helix-turn-helix transcriptional regulator [Burkholderiaceae bacterium]
MPNIASVLKEEIARVARKESRGDNLKLKKSSAQYRADIAALKRRVTALEQMVARLGKSSRRAAPAAAASEDGRSKLRFSAKGLASQRKRLELSAAQVAALLGVSGQSIYKWEDGKARPRASQLPAIATLRTMTKKQAAARLAELPG